MKQKLVNPDFLFEVSWEVCNKIGGIHTVIATKSITLDSKLGNKHIHIGPDIWRDTQQNPAFTEDPSLFRSWKASAIAEGLRIRIGRWNVTGKPIAILVDFTPLIPKKDEVFAALWEKFGVDSLNGNWDYIEAALFGYASGKVIESFVKFNVAHHDKVVAQFHEWMTGAGLLYLHGTGLPVGTIFTTHATVAGRCVASKNRPLYDSISSMNGDDIAREFGVSSRHSLEKASAKFADAFTTVSDITAIECRQFLGRDVDVITPNGVVRGVAPGDAEFSHYAERGRAKLIEVASAMTGESYADDVMIVGISGKYEFSNKGIDVFIDALGKMSASGYSGRKILAFIMVPTGNNGPDKELVSKLSGTPSSYVTDVTHYLIDDFDVIRKRLAEVGLRNGSDTNVEVFFVPAALDGNDGIFDMKYYELLIGMDFTIFPSYYEPWGYTPLESLAFRVPTLTTSLSGFGRWVVDHCPEDENCSGIDIVHRTDSNYQDVVAAVISRTERIASLSPDEMEKCRMSAKKLSEIALWDNLILYYREAFSLAIEKVDASRSNYIELSDETPADNMIQPSYPRWSSVIISRAIPESLKPLEEISMNLWWCWNQEAIDLFDSIDSDLWLMTRHNPLALLDKLTLKRYRELEKDSEFLIRLSCVYRQFREYMEGKNDRKGPKVAYFCMEYGLDASLKIYSGGLGILAGDYLKEASDMQVNMTAVGLLYRYGYFTQKLSADGAQVATYEPQDFMKIPAVPLHDDNGNWITVDVAFPGRNIRARIWRVDVGRTELYLLDTDFEENLAEDRQVTHQLYGGDWENRLKQELLLGVGGIRALRKLGIKADVFHCNEGHAAFTGLERLSDYINEEHLSFSEALEVVRASSLFTTHTPVPAGHDAFTEDLLRAYISHYTTKLKIDWKKLMSLGKIDANNANEKFSMSFLAANISQEVNGVSWLHGEVSRDIFAGMWPGYLPEELHVSYVTNGVHYPTWTAPEWKKIHSTVFGEDFKTHHYDKSCFSGIYQIPDKTVWATRQGLRKKLIDVVKYCIKDTTIAGHYSPAEIVKITDTLRDDVLTIGFARRFATYKRATLLFSNLDKLSAIVNNPERPVQFLFAGKAHPADGAGQDLIKQIIAISKMPQFIGKIVFVPNYDITIAKLLVQGVDVWMNNPTRPLEASGTSGEKAAMNGVMHFSVLDGWWVEGYKPGAGWALPRERTYDDQRFQNDLDSSTIYNIIENEIAPLFYAKGDNGISPQWVEMVKNTVAQVASNFTTNRMMTDYLNQYYIPQQKRSEEIGADDYKKARDIAFWKKKARREWPHVNIVSFTKPDNGSTMLTLGEESVARIVLNIGDLSPEDVGIEAVIAEQNAKGKYKIRDVFEFKVVDFSDGLVTYQANFIPDFSGMFQISARIFAKNPALPHRQDCELVKWL